MWEHIPLFDGANLSKLTRPVKRPTVPARRLSDDQLAMFSRRDSIFVANSARQAGSSMVEGTV